MKRLSFTKALRLNLWIKRENIDKRHTLKILMRLELLWLSLEQRLELMQLMKVSASREQKFAKVEVT